MAKESRHTRRSLAWRVALTMAVSVPSRAMAESATTVDVGAGVLQAESYAARAFEAYGRKEYAAAVALYEKAHQSAPSADALYNIARVYDVGLRDRSLAIEAYVRFLSDPGATPARMKDVNERLRELVEAERAASESRPTPANERSVRADVTVPAPGDPSEPKSSNDWTNLRTLALVSGAVGVVSVGVGIGFGLSALADANTANASCVGNRCTSQRAVDAAKAASTEASVATTAVSIGAALMVTGAALWLVDSASSSEGEAPARIDIVPVASATDLGMALSGRW